MPRATQSPAVTVLVYFQTAPLESAALTLELARHVVKGRQELTGQTTVPRKERSDKGKSKGRPADLVAPDNLYQVGEQK